MASSHQDRRAGRIVNGENTRPASKRLERACPSPPQLVIRGRERADQLVVGRRFEGASHGTDLRADAADGALKEQAVTVLRPELPHSPFTPAFISDAAHHGAAVTGCCGKVIGGDNMSANPCRSAVLLERHMGNTLRS